jgi:hypothetical protein
MIISLLFLRALRPGLFTLHHLHFHLLQLGLELNLVLLFLSGHQPQMKPSGLQGCNPQNLP